MRRVVLGVLCGLLAAAGVAASDAGTLGRARESLHPVGHPAKVAKLDSRLIALRAGKVHVELLATHPGRARAAVARRGGRVEAAYGRVIEALVRRGRCRRSRKAETFASSASRSDRCRSPCADRGSHRAARASGTRSEHAVRA